MRTMFLFAMLVPLAACASAADQQRDKMTQSLDPFKGRSIADYVAVKGPPTITIDLGSGKTLFQWLFTSQSAAVAVPVYGMIVARPSQTLECRVSFSAATTAAHPTLADWRIVSYQWAGAC